MNDQQVSRMLEALETVPAEPDEAFVARLRERLHSEATRAGSSVTRTEDLGEIMIDVLPSRSTTGDGGDTPRRSPRALVALVAAGVLLIVGVAATLVAVLDEDDDAAVGAASQPQPGEAVSGPVEVVEAAIDASNAGDLGGYYGFFADESPDLVTEIFARANRQIEIVEPCEAAPLDDGATLVECVLWTSDDFYGPAGVVDTATSLFTVNRDDKIVTWTDDWFESENGRCCPPLNAFNVEFLEWLETTHPDVFDEIGTAGDFDFATPGYLTRNPDHMTIALDFVDEFIAQSDNYPIEAAGN